jgi:hypothetical protein
LNGADPSGRAFSLAAQRRPANIAAVQGHFKTATLRNVELTGPYFHNGGQATLEQVIDSYARGGDFAGANLGRGIRARALNTADRQALVAFLNSLTDDRVRYERAPFDHPEICVPTGHEEDTFGVLRLAGGDPRYPLSAMDRWAGIPAVGRNGNTAPLQTFADLLAGVDADGSREHTVTGACAIPEIAR